MMSIVNDRTSDVILNSLNRLYDAKLSGALNEEELSKLIVLVGDLFANKINQGSVSNDEIESIESFLSGFTKANKDNYFNFNHKDLDRASKMFIEGVYVASSELEQKRELSSPVLDSDSYSRTYRKVA